MRSWVYIIAFLAITYTWWGWQGGVLQSCAFNLPIPPTPSGVLQPNQLLKKSTLIFSKTRPPAEGDDYHSPLRAESFAESEEGIYTGLGDGHIAIITLKGNEENDGDGDGKYQLEYVNRTGENLEGCGKEEMEEYCGRPLGLWYHKERKRLYVADRLGLLEMDTETKKMEVLVEKWEGRAIKFANSIAVSREDVLYFTDSSTKFTRSQVIYETMEGCPNGRLFQYDLKTRRLSLLLQGLHFPNGLQLTPDESSLLIAETTRARILKYNIATGAVTVFLENCPGFPDNIKYSPYSNVYWVGLSSARFLKPEPENFVLKALGLGRLPLGDLLGPYPTIRNLIPSIISTQTFIKLLPRYGLVIGVDMEGNIVKTLHDPSGEVGFVSEVVETEKGYLLLGSWKNDFIVQVDASQDLPLSNIKRN